MPALSPFQEDVKIVHAPVPGKMGMPFGADRYCMIPVQHGSPSLAYVLTVQIPRLWVIFSFALQEIAHLPSLEHNGTFFMPILTMHNS
jgi:hypothetical protein